MCTARRWIQASAGTNQGPEKGDLVLLRGLAALGWIPRCNTPPFVVLWVWHELDERGINGRHVTDRGSFPPRAWFMFMAAGHANAAEAVAQCNRPSSCHTHQTNHFLIAWVWHELNQRGGRAARGSNLWCLTDRSSHRGCFPRLARGSCSWLLDTPRCATPNTPTPNPKPYTLHPKL